MARHRRKSSRNYKNERNAASRLASEYFKNLFMLTSRFVLGAFLRVARDLLGATLIANGTNYTTSSLIHTAELRNLDTGAAFYFVRHDQST